MKRNFVEGRWLLAVLCLVAACTSGSNPTSTRTPSPTPSSSARATSTAGATATPTSAPTSAAAQPPAVVLAKSKFSPDVRFRSASGNLACWMYEGGVICRATEHSWTSRAPEPQTECPPTKRTSGIQLTENALTERSDCYDPAENSPVVLAYGHGLELHGVRCVSEERGITCRRTADGVGFSISRDHLSHTPWDSPLLHSRAESLDRGSATVFPAGFDVAFVVGEHFADCLLDDDLAACLVRSSATAPPGDPSCEFDQALTAELAGTQPGHLVYQCRSDANGGQDRLRDGESLQVGDLRCSVSAARLRCAHLGGSKHGFEVDSSSFRGF